MVISMGIAALIRVLEFLIQESQRAAEIRTGYSWVNTRPLDVIIVSNITFQKRDLKD
jgi:hypothetical protein